MQALHSPDWRHLMVECSARVRVPGIEFRDSRSEFEHVHGASRQQKGFCLDGPAVKVRRRTTLKSSARRLSGEKQCLPRALAFRDCLRISTRGRRMNSYPKLT